MIKIIPILLALTVPSLSTVPMSSFIPDGPVIIIPDLSFIGGFSRIDVGFSSKEEASIAISWEQSSSSSSLSSSSSSSSSSIDSSSEDYFYCEKYGPFLKEGDNKEVTFTYELNTISSQTLIERIRLFSKGTVVSASSQPSFSYTQGQRKSVSFTLNTKDYLTDSGLELRFEILNSSRKILKVYNATFCPPSQKRFLASNLKSGVYTSNSIGFYGDGTTMREIRESYDFTKIGDYIDNDYYYRLDIGRNGFYFDSPKELAFNSINLRFYDDEYLFPNFTHSSNDEIIIPLKVYQRNGKYSFQFVNKFYVNKKTLDVSDVYQPNYIVSSSFYLPINGLSKFNGRTIYLDINGLGMDEISTSIPLRYELNRLIVGSCSNGEYCVHGGTR